MKNILKICSIFIFVLGCSITPTTEAETENLTLKSATEAYKELQDKGVVTFNYSTINGERYWMWVNFTPDSSSKQTFVGHIAKYGSQHRKFYRNAVDVYRHNDMVNRKDEFIIDFGKAYDMYLTRFMYVKKTSSGVFRGKMISHIKWDVDTDFEIIASAIFPEGVNDTTYNDVTTSNKFIYNSILPFGYVSSFDALRNNDVVYFNYLTENGTYYYMWLDLRLGVENYMEMIYHKPNIKNTKFRSARKVFNILVNYNKDNEFIIDLGVANGKIPRYIYVLKTGNNAFRGKMINNPQWGLSTDFQISQSSFPVADHWSDDYNDITTSGDTIPFDTSQAGQNPKNYEVALAEALERVKGVTGFQKFSNEYKEYKPTTLVITHRKEFFLKAYNDDPTVFRLKFTWIEEYNGRDGSQLFGKYFGKRNVVSERYFETILPSEYDTSRITYKGQTYSVNWLKSKGFEWYITQGALVESIVNTHLGGDNIWHLVMNHLTRNTDFLVKKVSDQEYIILDLFQNNSAVVPNRSINITDLDFDIDNPSDKYRYTLRQ